jgi:alpha-D-xyloside xylohydrolase
LRSINSSIGLDTYAPSQRFSLDNKPFEIVSKGDETLELLDGPEGKTLIIQTIHDGILKPASPLLPTYSPPHWAYDFWFSTPWTRMSEAMVLKDINTAHEHYLSPKVWLLDAGWASETVYLDFDVVRFPNKDTFLQQMGGNGLKPIIWLAPYIRTKTALWNHFHKNGWFVKDATQKSAVFTVTGDNETLGSYIDVTSQHFLEFLQERITALSARGVAGIMFDFGESLPDDALFACETESAKQAKTAGIIGHNWYVEEAKRLLHAIASPLGLCLISRSGWTNSAAYTGLWLGDQSSDASRFAGLESVTWGYKTAREAQYRFIGMDVGGYFGVPTLEDYKHWLDLAAFMPYVLLHGALQSDPWEEGSDALSYYRKVHALHQKLWQEPQHVQVHFTLSPNHQRIREITAQNAFRAVTAQYHNSTYIS